METMFILAKQYNLVKPCNSHAFIVAIIMLTLPSYKFQ